jgi:hypothetical protein
MGSRSIRNAVVAGLVAVIVALASPSSSQALTVDPGWDLFQTVVPQTTFLGDVYKGVPLGTFNFGGTIGVQPTGPTDTIVQRLSAATATAGNTAVIPIQLVALQLMSAVPVDFTKFGGAGLHTAFITLHGTQASGTMGITFDATATATNQFGVFGATLPVSFDVRQDTLGGPIIASSSFTLLSSGNWTHIAPPGAVLINGANNNLDGTDNLMDFWTRGAGAVDPATGSRSQQENVQGGNEAHVVNPSGLGPNFLPSPEPTSTVLLVSAGLAGLLGWGRKRFAKKA